MDIRKWLTKKPATPTSNSSVNQSSTSAKKNTSRIIDSDSDEEINIKKKKKPVESSSKNKKKRIIDSSDESDEGQNAKKSRKREPERNRRSLRMQISDSSAEEVSPVKRKPSPVKRKSSPVKPKLKPQNKLENIKYTSKFFKETSANDVFGDEPVKRSDKKLKELQEKLKHFKPAKKGTIVDDDADFEAALLGKPIRKDPIVDDFEAALLGKPIRKDPIVDDDADFEAALLQLDEIGENWIDLPKMSKNKQSTSSNKNSPESHVQKNSVPQKKKNVQSSKVEKDSKKTSRQLDSLSSGYGSADSFALSSNSHSLDDSISERNPSVALSKLENKTKKEVPKTSSKFPSVLAEKKKETKSASVDKSIEKTSPSTPLSGSSSDNFSLWVEKYKPQSSKKIIGQQGEKSNVNKLIHWLKNWYKNNAGSKKATFVPGGWNKDQTGACFKAALLSGPPGVGKTTTVSLVCKELEFDLVEFNASDTRSKKLLQEEVSELLKCTSLTPFFTKQNSESAAVTKKHVLVMDEVDGMAGNEDRGGIQELIQLIKFTKVPIICMCNDRNHPKIRSLVNYCFDLRFARPRVEQIKGYMMSVCFKEKLQVSSEALVDIITSANNDVRLVLNHLSMLAADKNTQNLEAAKKYVKLSAWDVLRKVFSKEDHKKMSIHDKCDLFFFDYSIAPLFVQENYLSIKPLNPEAQTKQKKMELYARAAKCIGIGDLIDHRIRKNSSWSLLPTQAVFASYAPGEILEGYCSAQINFPSWLGKNSKQGRMDRLLQEVQIHTRLKISGSKESVNLDYAAHLKNRILNPLVERGTDGVKDALDVLHEYDLLKEDLDSLQEICQWSNNVHTMANLETKVKSAFTRAYNKNPPVRPYSLTAPIKKTAAVESLPDEEEDAEENEKSDDDTDAMIVTKKKPTAKKLDDIPASTSKAKAKTSTSTSQSKRSRRK